MFLVLIIWWIVKFLIYNAFSKFSNTATLPKSITLHLLISLLNLLSFWSFSKLLTILKLLLRPPHKRGCSGIPILNPGLVHLPYVIACRGLQVATKVKSILLLIRLQVLSIACLCLVLTLLLHLLLLLCLLLLFRLLLLFISMFLHDRLFALLRLTSKD